MRILNYGSMNLDYVYHVKQIVRPGETVKVLLREVSCGGKGLNQSIALARAGAPVWQAGLLGNDGMPLRRILEENGVNTSLIRELDVPSSHTVIQVDESGQNCILFCAPEELRASEDYLSQMLDSFAPGDFVLLQNELEGAAAVLRGAKQRGLRVVLNPSPANEALLDCPLELVDCFLLNETEGGFLTGETEPEKILEGLHTKYPTAMIVLTLGEKGSLCLADGVRYEQKCFPAEAVDTTAAGDTFTGYFLAGLLSGKEVKESLRRASMASALAVSRRGAAASIPTPEEVETALSE